MWPSVNGNVLTNQIDIRSEKTHEVTRCKQALNLHSNFGKIIRFYVLLSFLFVFIYHYYYLNITILV